MVRITCLGTGDAFNGAGRAHSCYWVDDEAGAFVVDFGPTALQRVHHTGRDLERLDAVFLTHLHGDHIGGLAVLLCTLQYEMPRARPLIIAGPPGAEARVEQLLESAYPTMLGRLRFPLLFKRWKVPGTVDVVGRSVQAIRARHDTLAIACSLRVEVDGRVLAFSGDTGWQPALAELAHEADLFLCECSGVEPGYWAHLDLATIAARRSEITARRLWLTHLSTRSRPVAEARATALGVTVADDGMVLELD